MALQWKNGRLQAGKLRHRINIVSVSPAQDSTGGINLSQTVIFENVWASIEALSGMETFAANTQIATSSHQILMRYVEDPSLGSLGRTPITAAMQVQFQGRQFQINSVLNPDEKNKMLCLLCTEINDSRQQKTTQPPDLG